MKNFKIFLTEIKGNPQHHHGWYRKGEYTCKRFFEQRKKRGQDYQYWVDNVKRDEQLLRRTLGAKGRMMAAEMKEEMSVEDKE